MIFAIVSPVNSEFVPFALPDIGNEECNAVLEALRSGWITTGPITKRFEGDFRDWLGDPDIECIAVNSATAGLHLALEAVGVKRGDEVITTTNTFTATAEVVRYLGANPILVDIDPETLNLDIDLVEKAITHKTKAIIPVHFGGLACKNEQIETLAKKHNLHIIEDAAHALPCTRNQKLIGSGDSAFTVFSFYATKTITTGEGGMVVTRNKELAKRCRIMRLHGISRDAFDRYTSKAPSWYYEVIAPGYKYNLGDVASAIGIEQLKKAYLFQERRSQISNYYNSQFGNLPIKLPPKPILNDLHAWHLYVIQIQKESRIARDAFIQAMFDAGIGCSVHFIPLHIHPYWRNKYKLSTKSFPQSTGIYQASVSLPIYSKLTDSSIERVARTVKGLLSA